MRPLAFPWLLAIVISASCGSNARDALPELDENAAKGLELNYKSVGTNFIKAAKIAPIFETPDFSIFGSGFTIDTLTNGGVSFSNRKYVWHGIPEKLWGWHYTQAAGGANPKIRVRAKRDALVQVITAMDQSGFNLRGWEQTDVEFHYSDQKNTRMVLFQKWLASGAEMDIPQGNWSGSLMLLPEADDVGSQKIFTNAFTNAQTNVPPSFPARTVSQAEASFLAAVTDAFAKHNADALVAITCWDRVPEKLKSNGRQEYQGILSAAAPPIKDIKLLDPKPPTLDWNVDEDPRFVELNPGWKEPGVVYQANLPIFKQLKITFASTKADDKTSLTITVTYPVGKKEGNLFFIEPAPAVKKSLIDGKVTGGLRHRLLVTVSLALALGLIGVAGWLGLCALWRRRAGWPALTQRFPMRQVQKLAESYSRQSGAFYRPRRHAFIVNYGFTVEFAREGVLVKAAFARNAPILIGWSDIFKIEEKNLFGSTHVALLAHYDKESVGMTNFVAFHIPPTALPTVMKHIPAEILQKTDSLSDLIRDRMDNARKPPAP